MGFLGFLTVFSWVFLGSSGIENVFLGFVLGFAGFYWVLMGFNEFSTVLLGFIGYSWVLLGFLRFYCFFWVQVGLKTFF